MYLHLGAHAVQLRDQILDLIGSPAEALLAGGGGQGLGRCTRQTQKPSNV